VWVAESGRVGLLRQVRGSSVGRFIIIVIGSSIIIAGARWFAITGGEEVCSQWIRWLWIGCWGLSDGVSL